MHDVGTIRRPLSMERGGRVTPDVTPQDLRALSWAERGAIGDRELDALIDRDVPGALSEFSLREWLRRHPEVRRETIKPHCAP